MIKSYLKIAWRNLLKNKISSFINIGGLAIGMAVAFMIGIWIWDELSFDKYHNNYDRIAKIRQHINVNGNIQTEKTVPYPLAEELRNKYSSHFRYIVMSSHRASHVLSIGEKKLTKFGVYMEPEAPEMLTLKMLKGTRAGLKDPSSILLSESAARSYFGDADPLNSVMKIDNKQNVKVTGVFEDLPYNSTFGALSFISPFELYVNSSPWIKSSQNSWDNSFIQTYVQIANNANMDNVSSIMRNIKLNKVNNNEAKYKPVLFLDPMNKWHLYSDFSNGVNVGGKIQYVWMFGIIGVFILLLACINFINLSTARSEKRAKETGIRKAIGSLRGQLIGQFFFESFMVVMIAFTFSLFLLQLILPFFNEVAGKRMSIPWGNPLFWLTGIVFVCVTGLIAGSYPALYLSSFKPLQVLKGTFRAGRYVTLPRKALVVLQFTVSVTLIICTIIVLRQIQFAKDRPVGYSRDGLLITPMITRDIADHFDAVKNELLKSGAIVEMASSQSTTTDTWGTDGNLDWKGKDPALTIDFPNTGVSVDYGKTVSWQFKAGRDFSRQFPSDSSGFILNEAAVKFMGLKDPVGEIIKWNGNAFKVIGVIKDVIVESPYEPVRPSIFCMAYNHHNFAVLKINPLISTRDALTKIETVFKKYNPSSPFDYKFADEEYNRKFRTEERAGKLAGFFALLAILISCLGLFGLVSFITEQRTKEIGIRKVLGASVFNVWRLLSKEFVILVIISLLIASPTAYYFMHNWLQDFAYRISINWWVFVIAGILALLIALVTISFQSIKAAIANPVKSLRTE